MRAAGPAAWPPHPFFELRANSLDMLPPCLIFLDGDGPADPLVACERRYVFPCLLCLRVGRERLSEISRELMYDSFGDSNGCHMVISLGVSLRARPSSDLYRFAVPQIQYHVHAVTASQRHGEAAKCGVCKRIKHLIRECNSDSGTYRRQLGNNPFFSYFRVAGDTSAILDLRFFLASVPSKIKAKIL
jgi:hypothetical protein